MKKILLAVLFFTATAQAIDLTKDIAKNHMALPNVAFIATNQSEITDAMISIPTGGTTYVRDTNNNTIIALIPAGKFFTAYLPSSSAALAKSKMGIAYSYSIEESTGPIGTAFAVFNRACSSPGANFVEVTVQPSMFNLWLEKVYDGHDDMLGTQDGTVFQVVSPRRSYYGYFDLDNDFAATCTSGYVPVGATGCQSSAIGAYGGRTTFDYAMIGFENTGTVLTTATIHMPIIVTTN